MWSMTLHICTGYYVTSNAGRVSQPLRPEVKMKVIFSYEKEISILSRGNRLFECSDQYRYWSNRNRRALASSLAVRRRAANVSTGSAACLEVALHTVCLHTPYWPFSWLSFPISPSLSCRNSLHTANRSAGTYVSAVCGPLYATGRTG